MTLKGNINNSQGSHAKGFVDSPQSIESQAANSSSPVKNLDQALRLTAKLHYRDLQGNEAQLASLIKEVKRLAANELEKGEGRKVESIRVERNLTAQ